MTPSGTELGPFRKLVLPSASSTRAGGWPALTQVSVPASGSTTTYMSVAISLSATSDHISWFRLPTTSAVSSRPSSA